MEEVFKNLEGVVQLLAVARSECVSQWDGGAVDRALRWTRYCEKLYARFKDNLPVRHGLEQVLRVTNQQLAEGFHEYRDIVFTDLAECHSLLLMTLLRNAAVSHSVRKKLFGQCEQCMAEEQSACDHSASHYLDQLVGYKAATKLLCNTLELKVDTELLDPETKTQGDMLSNRMDALVSLPDCEHRARRLLDRVLLDSKDGTRDVARVLAAAVLSSECTSGDRNAKDLILDWLQCNPGLLLSFCKDLPIGLLIRVAQQSATFRKAYFAVLENWVCSLEYDPKKGEWVPKSDNVVSFGVLVNHFRSLFTSDQSLRSEAQHLLTALKIADGDFDVRGLSASGDILNKLSIYN